MRNTSTNVLLFAIVVCLFLSAGISMAGIPGGNQVPPRFLQNGTLNAPEFNLNISAPGPDWEWTVSDEPSDKSPRGSRTFLCQQKNGSEIFIVQVFNPYWMPATQQNIETFASGAMEEVKFMGFDVADRRVTPSNIPMPGSYRFQVTAVHKTYGSKLYLYGYQVVNGRMFSIQHSTTEDKEPAEFTTFAQSFKMIGTPPKSFIPDTLKGRKELLGNITIGLSIFILLVVGGIGWIVNKSAGKIVINQWYIALALMFIALVFVEVFVVPNILGNNVGETEASRVAGFLVGTMILPALFAFWRSRVLKKQRAQENEPLKSAPLP